MIKELWHHVTTLQCHCGATRVPIGNRRWESGMMHCGGRDTGCFPADKDGWATHGTFSPTVTSNE